MKTISLSRSVVLLAMMLLGAGETIAQVNRSLGTLPAGGTVTITFDVIINTNFPAGTSSVTNQGSVTGTGFGPILTDDPSTPALNDPTVTAVTVAPQIACSSDITTNANACALPSIAFAATVAAGNPPPALTYTLGSNVITSPYTFPPGTNIVSVTATNGTTPDASCSFKVTVLAISPQLAILQSGTNIVLSWPATFPCFALQYTPALLSPPSSNAWTLHPGPFATNSGNIYVTNSLTGTNRFFRLAH